MMVLSNPNLKLVQRLIDRVDRAQGNGLIVSCYADMSVSRDVRSRWAEHLDREVQQIEPMLPDEPERRRGRPQHQRGA